MNRSGDRFRSSRHVPDGPLLRRIADLDDRRARGETVSRVCGASVVYADYDLLQRDFPCLRGSELERRHPGALAGSPADMRRLIDNWLLEHAAVISAPHVNGTDVNTPVRVRGRATAFRPHRYGRAVVVEAGRDGGLLDVKGAGVGPGTMPNRTIHANGLCELWELVHDLLIQWIFDEILCRAAPDIYTVPTYALIDLGFDVRLSDTLLSPAAIQVRRGHRRAVDANEIPRSRSPEAFAVTYIESLLRCFGLTSACSVTRFRIRDVEGCLDVMYGKEQLTNLSEDAQRIVRRHVTVGADPIEVDAINVQLAREVGLDPVRAQIVDLGHYRFLTDAERPVVNLVRDRPLRWGATSRPSDPRYVRPIAALRILESDFSAPPGCASGVPEALRLVGLDEYAFVLADSLRRGAIDRTILLATLQQLIDTMVSRWDRNGAFADRRSTRRSMSAAAPGP